MQAISMIDMEREGLIKNYKSPLSIGGQQLLSHSTLSSASLSLLSRSACATVMNWPDDDDN